MCLKEGKSGRVYEVLALSVEPELEQRLNALGLTPGTRVAVLNNEKKGAVVVKFRGVRFAFGKRIADHILVKEAESWREM